MNVEIDKEENSDINHKVRHVIKLMKDWIKRAFKHDLIPQMVVFHAQSHPTKRQRSKVTVSAFTAQSPVRPEIVHQLDRLVGYYRAQKGKGKRKRIYPQWAKLDEKETQAPPQQGEENVQGPKNVEATQAQDDPQVLPVEQGQGEAEKKVQEVSLVQ